MERLGPSILVEAGKEKLLFDCGRGATMRLYQLKIPFDDLNALFLTHLHSDHIVGISDFYLTGWILGRSTPLRVWGPAGTADMMSHLEQAYQFDIHVRRDVDEMLPAPGVVVAAKDIEQGVIYQNGDLKVTAFTVDHAPIKPAFGYRIDYGGHSVVLSGDTRYSENLIHFAQGTDLLVHEVAIASDTLKKSDPRYNILAHHTTPEQASKVFTAVEPKLAVYSHIVRIYQYPEEEILKRTKENYRGPVILGEDLMSFSVGEKVTIK